MSHSPPRFKAVLPPRAVETRVIPGPDGQIRKVILALDNGVRIESGGSDAPGRYILIADADGQEIGYWNASDWGDEDEAAEVMRKIVMVAATAGLRERGAC